MARTLKIVTLLIAALLVAGSVVIRGINSRIKAAAIVKQETLDLAVPTVAAIHAKRGALKDEIVLPGNMQPFVDSPIYARTSGYLKKWYTDIGTRVKTGQLLAEIESPEVDQQLAQARADLGTAQANMKLAELTMARYQNLLKLDAIAKQDVDNAAGAYEADKAAVAAQSANVKRLEQMVAFEKVFAPFDGVITARNTDVGALINAGNGERRRSCSTWLRRISCACSSAFHKAIRGPPYPESPPTSPSPNFPAAASPVRSRATPTRSTPPRARC